MDLEANHITLTVIANDGHGGVARSAFFLDIVNANNPPIVSLITNAVTTEGVPFQKDLSISFTDPDGDKLVYALNGLPVGTGLTINPETGVMEGVPNENDVNEEGPWPLRVQAIDGKGGWSQGQFFLTVKKRNNAPNAVDIPPAQGVEGKPFAMDTSLFFQDEDQQALMFDVRGLPPGTGLSFRGTTGILEGVPTIVDRLASPLSLKIRAKDGAGGQASSVLFLVILPANQPPESKPLPPATVRVAERVRIEMAPYFFDPEGHVLVR